MFSNIPVSVVKNYFYKKKIDYFSIGLCWVHEIVLISGFTLDRIIRKNMCKFCSSFFNIFLNVRIILKN